MKTANTKKSKHRNTSPTNLGLIAAIALLAATGIALIGNGIWIKAKAQLAQILLNQAFERVQSNPGISSQAAKPWKWADMQPLARISAPKLQKSAIILDNVSGEALAFGPGHLPNTALPGERGTAVLAAHRDTHFSWIQHLKPGDRIEVENKNGSTPAFLVKRSWIAPYDASGIDPDSQDALLVLSTCYPFNARTPGPLRYMVEAELVSERVTVSQLK